MLNQMLTLMYKRQTTAYYSHIYCTYIVYCKSGGVTLWYKRLAEQLRCPSPAALHLHPGYKTQQHMAYSSCTLQYAD